MPGFNQQQLDYKARSGNTVVVLIGDQPIAFAQTVTHSFDFGAEGFYGIGSAKPQEIQQLRNTPTITIDQLNLTQDGRRLTQGGSATALVGLLANNSFNIVIVDGDSQEALFTYVGCVSGNFNESVPMNAAVTDATTFLAMDVLGQDGQSLLNGPNAYDVNSQLSSVTVGGIGLTVGISG